MPATATPAGAKATPEVPQPCDPIDPAACLLPFPNDYFTVADPSTDTGRRVNLAAAAMPRNRLGNPIDPAGWNRNDGFSPGAEILTHVPGVDLAETGAAPITDIAQSLAPRAPIVLLNARTLERHPYWAELDATTTDEARQALIIRPARNLDEGARYIVALRMMRDANGDVIPPNPAFAAFLRGNNGDGSRRAHMKRLFATLARAGVKRRELYLAWDFTVASTRNLTERLLHIRDDAFDSLGGAAPHFTVTGVTELTNAENPRIARRVEGTFDVPSYLDQPGGPPDSGFNYSSSDGLPTQLPGNTQVAAFVCNIPRAAKPGRPGHAALYGHGLFDDASDVDARNVQDMANEHAFVFCGTDWIGLTGDDVLTAGRVFSDFSRFPAFADRLQQGVLNALFLGRLMINPRGFASHPAFRAGSPPTPLIDAAGGLVYDGNSLGGIMGGTLTAVAQDFTRAVLGVPGMNFSTLLNRSVQFPTALLDVTYPDKLDQQLVFSLVQMLWDRAEADGYAHHVTTAPLPDTPVHRVLLHVAFGDHQVANVSSDVEARTIGLSIRGPPLARGRSLDREPYWAVPPIRSFPFAGSAMVVWDSGTPPPPTSNTPPTEGVDPHEDPRASPLARFQKAVFFATGAVVDVCRGPCQIPHA